MSTARTPVRSKIDTGLRKSPKVATSPSTAGAHPPVASPLPSQPSPHPNQEIMHLKESLSRIEQENHDLEGLLLDTVEKLKVVHAQVDNIYQIQSNS